MVGLLSYFLLNNLLAKVNYKNITQDDKQLGIDPEVANKLADKGVINILLFGLDQRTPDEPGRSDAMMILSLDTKRDKIKLTSIMRDSYVDIDKHGKDKLNHAYAYGGPELAIKTINQNFNLNIKKYATVNFYSMQEIIDSVGGVEIDIKQKEVKPVNDMMNELAYLGKYDPPHLKNAGVQTLNGRQALAYARTRYVGNDDFERTERQRTVLMAIFSKVKTMNVTSYPAMVSKLLPLVETNLTKTEILSLASKAAATGFSKLEQERFPVDSALEAKTIKGTSYLIWQKDTTIKQLYNYIFEDIKPTNGN